MLIICSTNIYCEIYVCIYLCVISYCNPNLYQLQYYQTKLINLCKQIWADYQTEAIIYIILQVDLLNDSPSIKQVNQAIDAETHKNRRLTRYQTFTVIDMIKRNLYHRLLVNKSFCLLCCSIWHWLHDVFILCFDKFNSILTETV